MQSKLVDKIMKIIQMHKLVIHIIKKIENLSFRSAKYTNNYT